jgi:anti-anti-sigma regulatory factor
VAPGRHAAVAVPVRSGEHACCRFDEADDRKRLAVAFVRDRLRRGDKVVYFADGDGAGPFDTRLDPAFAPAKERGQLEVRGSHDVYLPNGRFDPQRVMSLILREHERAAMDGYRGLSVSGEVPHAICEVDGGDQLTAYEAQVATEFDAPSYSLLCQYDHRRFERGVLDEVAESHELDAAPELAAIGRAGELAAMWDRRANALRLAGELDFACADTVSQVLLAHGRSPLRLDLSDLTYVDVAGMRALRGENGEQLEIGPVSHAVRRLIPLLGWDTDPGIELMEAQ